MPQDIDSLRLWSNRSRDPQFADEAPLEIKRIGWYAYVYDRAKLAAVSAGLSSVTFNPQVASAIRANDSASPYDFRQQLKVLFGQRGNDLPLYLIGGDVDQIAVFSNATLKAIVPNASVAVIPRSGHFPWIEAPDAFFQALDIALKSTR